MCLAHIKLPPSSVLHHHRECGQLQPVTTTRLVRSIRMSIDLTPYAGAINTGLAEGSFCVVATQGAQGIPDIGFKGSVQVFDRDHLSYWERTRGGHLANLRQGN